MKKKHGLLVKHLPICLISGGAATTDPRKTLSRRTCRLAALDSTIVAPRLVQDLLVDEHRIVTCTQIQTAHVQRRSESLIVVTAALYSHHHRRDVERILE